MGSSLLSSYACLYYCFNYVLELSAYDTFVAFCIDRCSQLFSSVGISYIIFILISAHDSN